MFGLGPMEILVLGLLCLFVSVPSILLVVVLARKKSPPAQDEHENDRHRE